MDSMQKAIHENAVKHGWWEGTRPMEDVVALIHSEWSEALEAYRDGLPLTYKDEHGKPEGIATELIDGVIRVLDAAEAWGIQLFEDDTQMNEAKRQAQANHFDELTLPELVCKLHQKTSKLTRKASENTLRQNMGIIVAAVWVWVDWQGESPDLLLREKHEFNKTRPYKHGGKVI